MFRYKIHWKLTVFGHFLYLTIDELLIEGTFLWKFTQKCGFIQCFQCFWAVVLRAVFL